MPVRRLEMSVSTGMITFLLLAMFALSVSQAQISTGTIVGTVRDGNGGVVPNANVTLTEAGTSQAHQARTNDQGEFNAQFMPLGTY
jgi:hypothetical protein